VVAIREHAAHAPEQSVEPASHPNLEAPHRTAERVPVRGFDDQVKMVALHREMNEAHIQAFLRLGKGTSLDAAGERILRVSAKWAASARLDDDLAHHPELLVLEDVAVGHPAPGVVEVRNISIVSSPPRRTASFTPPGHALTCMKNWPWR
jgi:hypothetical protein